VLIVKPRNAIAWRSKHTPSVGNRPRLSESGPIASRPANPANPMTLTVLAARKGEIPRSIANGTIWTIGMNTTSHVKVKMAFNSQNALVPLASRRVQLSAAKRSGAAMLEKGFLRQSSVRI